jgi:nucleoside-diphosphate-sugar epimerase
MHALVTGAGGFLGRSIAARLAARGTRVRGFARGSYPELAASGVEMVQGDVRDEAAVEAACRGVDTVFHVAAVAGIWGSWEHFHAINVLGTSNVLAGCRRQGVAKLVYTSSPSVTFEARDQEHVDESAPYARKWLCHYPHTKALAEREVLAADGRAGLLTCALRPHLIWGPGDSHLIPRLIDRARRGQLLRIGPGTNLMDAVYVDNAALAHVLAAERLQPGSPVCGRPYFITNGEPVNCWEWINQILDLAGLPPVRRSISFRVAWHLGHGLEILWRLAVRTREPRMTRFLAAQLATSHYFDITAARRDLGYEPAVLMADGMQRLAAWLRSGDGRVQENKPGASRQNRSAPG